MAVSDVTAAMTTAAGYIASGDYASAITQALAAKAHLAAIPDGAMQGGLETKWDRKSIDDFITACRRQQAGSYGLQTNKITIARPTLDDS